MEILVQPQITEKAMKDIGQSKYVFRIHSKANKVQVARAVEDLYKVKVQKVNIIRIPREEKILRGRIQAMIKGVKKAIVTLKKGQKIPGFEEK